MLIEKGTIVTESTSFQGDILISGGKIKEIGEKIEKTSSTTKVIDAGGCFVFPGAVDVHVHMELPVGPGLCSSDDFESGSRAALAGGTTTIIDFVTPLRGQPLPEALAQRKEQARKSLCDYGLHMSITSWNKHTASEMKNCVEKEGITSFKVYMAYKDTIGLEDRELIPVMDTAAKLGALVAVHCENGDVIKYLQEKFLSQGKTSPRFHPLSRPAAVEREAVLRALTLSAAAGCALYIVHVSTEGALAEIAAARLAGQKVLAETCPHYLLLEKKEYLRPDSAAAAYVMSPPLRPKGHGAALWQALRDDVLQVVATDHCPFNRKQASHPDFSKIPNGVAGVENRLALLYTYGVLQDKISLNRFVEITASAPAKIFGLYPRKGALQPGSDADILIWDPAYEGVISAETHLHNCDTNIFEGFPIKGKPRLIIRRGKIAYEKDSVMLKKGAGLYIPRGAPGLYP